MPKNRFEEAQADEPLRKTIDRLLGQLATAKAQTADLVQAVRDAVTDAMSGLQLDPVPTPKRDGRKAGAEVAIAILSDWQLAKLTPSYNTAMCEKRIELYGDKVIELANIQRAHHPVRELRVYLAGDLVEGELIFPGQQWRIDASLYRQVCVDGPRILGNFLRKMLGSFDSVHVVTVIGNHGALGGRARRDYHPESNADAMLSEIARQLLERETRLTWGPTATQGERHWYQTDTIGEHTFFVFHGDQVRGGFAGIPWYGFYKRILGWRSSRQIPQFDYAVAGHFHTPTRMFLNGTTLWVNGSTESDNTYALEDLSASGEPCQWLLFCSPGRGVSAEYLVQLG